MAALSSSILHPTAWVAEKVLVLASSHWAADLVASFCEASDHRYFLDINIFLLSQNQ